MSFRKKLHEIDKNKEFLVLCLPAVLFTFIFAYIPMVGLYFAFVKFDFKVKIYEFWKMKFVGFDNFLFLLNDRILEITRNTICFNILFIFTGTVVSIIFALMLFELGRNSVKFFQTIYIIPNFLSWVVAAYIGIAFLDMDQGWINSMLKNFGQEPLLWYSEPKYWPVILILVNLWKGVGIGIIFYYTGLLGIDTEYFEAAQLDGASRLQQIRHISIPHLIPLVILMTLMAVGSIFRADFGLFYQFTQNSSFLYPVTDVIDTYVYRALKVLNNMGMAAAAGFFQSVVGFVMVLTTNFILRKTNEENAVF